MTFYEVSNYLDSSPFLIFQRKSQYYSIIKSSLLFHKRYLFIPTDGPSQQEKSLEGLWEKVFFPDSIPLWEGMQEALLIYWTDLALETYEGIRHLVMVYGVEVRFQYRGRFYWITHTKKWQSLLSAEEENNYQLFLSRRELFEKAHLEGKTLKEIWPEVIVDTY